MTNKNKSIDYYSVFDDVMSLAGVINVAVITREVNKVSFPFSSRFIDNSLLEEILNSFNVAEIMGMNFSFGYLTHTILEYDTNKLIMATFGNNVLVVLTEGSAVLGTIRHQINKTIAKLVSIL